MTANDESGFDDILNDPHKYGAPTFQEFCKNPDKWLAAMAETAKLALIEDGPKFVRNIVTRERYFVSGYECDTLEKVESVAKAENIDLRYARPELKNVGGQKGEIHIHWNKKKEEPRSGLIIAP